MAERNIGMEVFNDFFRIVIRIGSWLISTLFKLIRSLIRFAIKKIKEQKSNEAPNSGSLEGNPVHQYDYNDCIRDWENANNEHPTKEALVDRYHYLFVNTLVNGGLTVDQKCMALEYGNKLIESFYNQDLERKANFLLASIESSFEFVVGMCEGSMIMESKLTDFQNDVKNGNIQPLTNYIGTIMSLVGGLYASGHSFRFDNQIMDKYDLPKIA